MSTEIKWSSRKFEVIHQTEPARGFNLKLLIKFISILRKINPDLIHVRGLGNEGFHAVLAAKIAGVPNILLTIHGTQRDLKYKNKSIRRWIVVNLLENISLRLSTHIATVCEFTARRNFLNPFRHKLIGFVNNGVEIPTINNEIKFNSRKSFGISDDQIIGVCVSRITAEKGYYILADALRLLDNQTNKFTLYIIGDGDDANKIKKYFEGIKNIKIIFTGHENDVQKYLLIADIFIFPSFHENHSLALLEAISHGLPAIASSVGGNIETLRDGGGILVPPGDPESLCNAIKKYINNPEVRSTDGFKARQVAIEKYSAQSMASNWDKIYSKIEQQSHGK